MLFERVQLPSFSITEAPVCYDLSCFGLHLPGLNIQKIMDGNQAYERLNLLLFVDKMMKGKMQNFWSCWESFRMSLQCIQASDHNTVCVIFAGRFIQQVLQLQPWGFRPLQATARLQRRTTLGPQLIFAERAGISLGHVSTCMWLLLQEQEMGQTDTNLFNFNWICLSLACKFYLNACWYRQVLRNILTFKQVFFLNPNFSHWQAIQLVK